MDSSHQQDGSAVDATSASLEGSQNIYEPPCSRGSIGTDFNYHEITVENMELSYLKMEVQENDCSQKIDVHSSPEDLTVIHPHEEKEKILASTDMNPLTSGVKRRKRKSLESVLQFLKHCSNIAKRCGTNALYGPIRLATCPRCSVEYKNDHDRLLLLANHITARHKDGSGILLKAIMHEYKPLILFMERKYKELLQ